MIFLRWVRSTRPIEFQVLITLLLQLWIRHIVTFCKSWVRVFLLPHWEWGHEQLWMWDFRSVSSHSYHNKCSEFQMREIACSLPSHLSSPPLSHLLWSHSSSYIAPSNCSCVVHDSPSAINIRVAIQCKMQLTILWSASVPLNPSTTNFFHLNSFGTASISLIDRVAIPGVFSQSALISDITILDDYRDPNWSRFPADHNTLPKHSNKSL